MRKTKAIEPKKHQSILCSTMNSEISQKSPSRLEISSLTPILLNKPNIAKKTVDQSKSGNSGRNSSSNANSSVKLSNRKKKIEESKNEKLQETLDNKYIKYLQSLETDKEIEGKYRRSKTEVEAQIADVSKRLQSHRELLIQVNKRLSDITFSSEMEDIIKLQESSYDDCSEIQSHISLDSIHNVDEELDELINSVPTKNVMLPIDSGIAEFQSVLEDTLASLKEINEASTSHGDSYVMAKNDLVKMKSSQEDIKMGIQKFEQQKPVVQSNLLLQSSRKQDRGLKKYIPQVPDNDLESTLRLCENAVKSEEASCSSHL